jgi:hypothetical protein
VPRNALGQLSSRLAGLIEGDLAGYQREADEDGRVRFVPVGDGPVLDVASRVEKRFLGRTEIAVFGVNLDVGFGGAGTIELRHTGRIKRTGVTTLVMNGGESVQRLASALASDRRLAEALLPLDFTRFEIALGVDLCRIELELMGASHVAIALPPIRSYIHLHPDQRKAMIAGIEEIDRVVRTPV